MAQDLREAMLRESLPQDAEQLKRLWCDVFGDPPELVDAFLSLLPEMGCGCVAEHDGRILGAAYLIHGFTLLRPVKDHSEKMIGSSVSRPAASTALRVRALPQRMLRDRM